MTGGRAREVPARLALRVSPGGPGTRVMGRMADGRLKLRVAAKPERGEANAELVAFLARELGLARAAVRIAAGHASRDKMIEIDAPASRVSGWAEAAVETAERDGRK